jgi:hypothetical protein
MTAQTIINIALGVGTGATAAAVITTISYFLQKRRTARYRKVAKTDPAPPGLDPDRPPPPSEEEAEEPDR